MSKRPTVSASEFIKIKPILRYSYNVKPFTIKELKQLKKDYPEYTQRRGYIELVQRYIDRQKREGISQETHERWKKSQIARLTPEQHKNYSEVPDYLQDYYLSTLQERRIKKGYSVGDMGFFITMLKKLNGDNTHVQEIIKRYNELVQKLTAAERYQLIQDLPENVYYVSDKGKRRRTSVTDEQAEEYYDEIDDVLYEYEEMVADRESEE